MVGVVLEKRRNSVILDREKLVVPQYPEDYIFIGNGRQIGCD